MHNASTMAGMAFCQCLPWNEPPMAHKIGGRTTQFMDVPMQSCFHMLSVTTVLVHLRQLHGLSTTTGKRMKIPRHRSMLGLPHSTPEEAVEAYAKAVYDLGEKVGIKMNFKDQGIDEKNGRQPA